MVAEKERPDFAFEGEAKESVLDELADAVKNAGGNEAEIARLVYQANTRLTWRQIAEELLARGAHAFSYSWLYRLGAIWEWWVVKMRYAPSEVFALPRNKLYFAAKEKINDINVVASAVHMSDGAFRRAISTTPREEKYVVSLSQGPYETLQRLKERISGMTGHNLSVASVLEFVVEAFALLSDRVILELWNAAHGETNGEPD